MYAKIEKDNISFSGRQLANFDDTTLQTLASRIRPGEKLQARFIEATNDIANSPELMGSLRPEQRAMYATIRKAAGEDASMFEAGSNAGQQQTGQTGQQQQTAQPTPQPAQQTGQPMPQPTPQPAQQTVQPAPQPVQQTGQPTLPSQPPAVIIPPINPPASTASNQNSGQQNNFGNNIAEALRNNANSTADVANGLKNLRGAIENNNNSQVFEVRNTGGEPTGQIVNNQNIVNNTNNTTTNENNNLSAQFDASLRGLEANRFERIIPRGNNRRDNKSNNNNSNPDDNPSSNGESDS